MVDALPATDALKNFGLLIRAVRRYQNRDGLTYSLSAE